MLQISPRTVEFHRYRAMESIGLHTIAEVVQYAIKHHMVSAEPSLKSLGQARRSSSQQVRSILA
jgi:hypothetical protein